MFVSSKLIFFKKYFLLLLFIKMSNNICVDFSYIDGVLAGAKKEIAPGVSNVLGSIFGYELLFLFSKNKEIQEINFFNKAVILFLEQIVIQYTGITPHYNRFIKAITLRLGDKFKSKFIFNRAKICKNYPTNFSFNIV
jgi:hypothetical protein